MALGRADVCDLGLRGACCLSLTVCMPLDAAGEKLWRMPMEESYWEQMKSPIADMKNTGGRMGGAITAALFLEKYVDTDKASGPVPIPEVYRK